MCTSCRRTGRRDHPRSRGVYEGFDFAGWMAGGSSPLARGLLNLAVVDIPFEGIIPARAGFTPAQSLWRPAEADHPRSRGVYFLSASWNLMSAGSSPLARGLLQPGRVLAGHLRIIPARAGFTPTGTTTLPVTRDHPRSRGVYDTLAHWAGFNMGSSPLARGLPASAAPHTGARRIIPARAGFTRSLTRPRSAVSDHPRSRGVYLTALASWIGWLGSSPLARGLLGRRCLLGLSHRIIPARAGFTVAGAVSSS